MKVVVVNSQSFFDLANQVLGSADTAFELAHYNNMSVTDDLVPGTVIEIPTESALIDEDVALYFDNKMLATWAIAQGAISPTPGGVGYMGIEVDFIVS